MDYTAFVAQLLLLPILISVCVWGVWQYFAKSVTKTVQLRFLRCGGQVIRRFGQIPEVFAMRREYLTQRDKAKMQGA
jgi:hypothetical protein